MVEEAWARVDRDRLVDLLVGIVNIASPTGEEEALAAHIAARMADMGLESEAQPIGGHQANAIGRIAGTGGGASLLLYAPLDTVTVGTEAEDLPQAGSELRADMLPHATVDGDLVIGLGAQNPKGHAACILAAAEAIHHSRLPLAGDLILGFGAGGMPSDPRPGIPPHSAHGYGCQQLLARIGGVDQAIIAKSGWTVSHEEVGFIWFDIDVFGTHNYVGSRHLLPFRSAILDAARLVQDIEAWFPTWTEKYRSGLVAPQGIVSTIDGGWQRMPAFTPAVCRIRCDLRLAPDTSFVAAEAEFGAAVRNMAARHGIECRITPRVRIAGTRTDATAAVIRASIDAWEAIEGCSHQPVLGTSGATDANILRLAGIPTARVGLGKAKIEGLDFTLGMNAASVPEMERLTRHLIHAAIALCADAQPS